MKIAYGSYRLRLQDDFVVELEMAMLLKQIHVERRLLSAFGLDDGDGVFCGAEQAVDGFEDFVFGDGADFLLDVVHCVEFTEVERLFGHADEALFRVVGAEVHASHDVRLGACEFVFQKAMTQEFLDFGDGKMECRLELVWLSGESDAPIDAILVEIGC